MSQWPATLTLEKLAHDIDRCDSDHVEVHCMRCGFRVPVGELVRGVFCPHCEENVCNRQRAEQELSRDH